MFCVSFAGNESSVTSLKRFMYNRERTCSVTCEVEFAVVCFHCFDWRRNNGHTVMCFGIPPGGDFFFLTQAPFGGNPRIRQHLSYVGNTTPEEGERLQDPSRIHTDFRCQTDGEYLRRRISWEKKGGEHVGFRTHSQVPTGCLREWTI